MTDQTENAEHLEKVKRLARFLGQDASLNILSFKKTSPGTEYAYFVSDLEWNPVLELIGDGDQFRLYSDHSTYDDKTPMMTGYVRDTPVDLDREVQLPCPEPDGAGLSDIVKMATAMIGSHVLPVSVNESTVRLWCPDFDTIGAAHIEAEIEEDGVVAFSIDGHGTKMRGRPADILEERVSFEVKIAVTDREEFDNSFPNHTTTDGMRVGMLDCDLEEAGILNLEVSNIDTEIENDEQKITFTVSADIPDPAKLTRAAREAYEGAWMDESWVPSGPVEALYEYTLASNDNASPDECGFAFEETPGSLENASSHSQVSLAVDPEQEPEPAGMEM